eukprot:gb/GECG01014498.1/.p1 GENE.gb/GECG01014498.1/~~gb/GECG01014498.1/.p1  ORF type:complete len:749 (+),score=134.13 gb/GECG01014498.1/:1-2247(+)
MSQSSEVARILELTDPDRLAHVSIQELQLGLSESGNSNDNNVSRSAGSQRSPWGHNRHHEQQQTHTNKPRLQKSVRRSRGFQGSRLYTLPEEQPRGSPLTRDESFGSLSRHAESVDSNVEGGHSEYNKRSSDRKHQRRSDVSLSKSNRGSVSSQISSPASEQSTAKQSHHSETYEQTRRRNEEQCLEKRRIAREAEEKYSSGRKRGQGRLLNNPQPRRLNVKRSINFNEGIRGETLYTPSSKSTLSKPDFRKAATDKKYAGKLADKVIESEKRRRQRQARQKAHRQRNEEQREYRKRVAQAQRARASQLSKPSPSRRQQALKQRQEVENREQRRNWFYQSPKKATEEDRQSPLHQQRSAFELSREKAASKTDGEMGLRKANYAPLEHGRKLGHVPQWLLRRKEELNKSRKTNSKSAIQNRVPFWERMSEEVKKQQQENAKKKQSQTPKTTKQPTKKGTFNLSRIKLNAQKGTKDANIKTEENKKMKHKTVNKAARPVEDKSSVQAAKKPRRIPVRTGTRNLPPRSSQRVTESNRTAEKPKQDGKGKSNKRKTVNTEEPQSPASSRRFSSRITDDEDGYSDSFDSFSGDDEEDASDQNVGNTSSSKGKSKKGSSSQTPEPRLAGNQSSAGGNGKDRSLPRVGVEAAQNDQAKVAEEDADDGFFLTSYLGGSNKESNMGKEDSYQKKKQIGTPLNPSGLPSISSTSTADKQSQHSAKRSDEHNMHKFPSISSINSDRTQQSGASDNHDWF